MSASTEFLSWDEPSLAAFMHIRKHQRRFAHRLQIYEVTVPLVTAKFLQPLTQLIFTSVTIYKLLLVFSLRNRIYCAICPLFIYQDRALERMEYLKKIGRIVFIIAMVVTVACSWFYYRKGNVIKATTVQKHVGINYTQLDTEDPEALVDK